jgi:hypothetical protein
LPTIPARWPCPGYYGVAIHIADPFVVKETLMELVSIASYTLPRPTRSNMDSSNVNAEGTARASTQPTRQVRQLASALPIKGTYINHLVPDKAIRYESDLGMICPYGNSSASRSVDCSETRRRQAQDYDGMHEGKIRRSMRSTHFWGTT